MLLRPSLQKVYKLPFAAAQNSSRIGTVLGLGADPRNPASAVPNYLGLLPRRHGKEPGSSLRGAPGSIPIKWEQHQKKRAVLRRVLFQEAQRLLIPFPPQKDGLLNLFDRHACQ